MNSVMIAPGTFAKRPAIVSRAMERRGLAFLHSLAETCREWPELRQWLFEDFVRNEATRANFQALVGAPATADATSFGLADLADEASGWHKERARLRSATGASPRVFGGRTWEEMEQVVYRYEGGVTELGVFVLARHWRKMGSRAKYAPEPRSPVRTPAYARHPRYRFSDRPPSAERHWRYAEDRKLRSWSANDRTRSKNRTGGPANRLECLSPGSR